MINRTFSRAKFRGMGDLCEETPTVPSMTLRHSIVRIGLLPFLMHILHVSKRIPDSCRDSASNLVVGPAPVFYIELTADIVFMFLCQIGPTFSHRVPQVCYGERKELCVVHSLKLGVKLGAGFKGWQAIRPVFRYSIGLYLVHFEIPFCPHCADAVPSAE